MSPGTLLGHFGEPGARFLGTLSGDTPRTLPGCTPKLECRKWGVTNGGLRGVWPPVLEIGRNRPFSPFFCLFRPFPEGLKSTWKIQKTEEKGLFVKRQTPSLLPAPLPKAHYKTQTTMPRMAQGKESQSARALHYDSDYNDSSEREQRVLGDDRRTRRLQRQELLSWLYVIVCVTTITITWRRKRDRLPWSLPQEYWHKEKGATTTQ